MSIKKTRPQARWQHKFCTVAGRALDSDDLNALAVDGWEVVSILPHVDSETGRVWVPVRMVVVLKRKVRP